MLDTLTPKSEKITESFPSISCLYHTECHGVSRIFFFSSRYFFFIPNFRIFEFLLITRRIVEGHGRQKFANSQITSLRSVGPRTSLVTRKIRDRPCEEIIRKFDNS